jgi:hypothetical protein
LAPITKPVNPRTGSRPRPLILAVVFRDEHNWREKVEPVDEKFERRAARRTRHEQDLVVTVAVDRVTKQVPGTDVTILKIFSPKILAKIGVSYSKLS